MHLILLSGGSGKRLWPLSNDTRSKQFLQVLPGPDGTRESMVQRVYRQLKEVGGWDSITVAAGAAQKDQLGLQLGKEVNLVMETERRDTFPAIALACAYLYSEKGVKESETIAVLPVDPFVELDYFNKIAEFREILNSDSDELVLMGAFPTFPSEKYGYIVPKDTESTLSEVKYFKEKPDKCTAERLMQEGALWNCGVFGLKLGYMIRLLKERYHIADLSYSQFLESFHTLEKTSFDYEVVEHAEHIQVIRYNGTWKDLGTWETLTEEMASNLTGNAYMDHQCENTHVINEQDIPVVAMGLKNAVLVASRDGILVAEKGETYRLKEQIAQLNQRPMYEEKRWGRYIVLSHQFYVGGVEALTKRLLIDKGSQISYQYHTSRKEIWTILTGEGTLRINGELRQVSPGDVIQINEGDQHAILANTDLELIEVQLGSPLIEEDIVRLEMNW